MKALVAAAAAAVSFGVSAQNLVANGSFESGTFSPPSNQTMAVISGSNAITAWSVISLAIDWVGAGNPWSVTALDGARYIDLTGNQPGAPYATIEQTIATVPGTPYLLSFSLGSHTSYGIPVGVTATAGTTQQTFQNTIAGNNLWTPQSMSFTAASSSTVIRFQGSAGTFYIGLDNVAVSAVPELPASAYLLAGLAGLMWLRRRAR